MLLNLEEHPMNKKEKCISIAGLILSVFLFICAAINLANRQVGAAIGSLGSGVFFLALALAVYEKSKGNKQ